MSAKKTICIALLSLGAWLLPSAQALGAQPPAQPAWGLSATVLPTNIAPGAKGEVLLIATNIGGKATNGAITLTDTLPDKITPLEFEPHDNDPASSTPKCSISVQTITCTVSANRATGNGDIAAGSTKVTGLTTATGSFIPGTEIQGAGIPADTTIVSVSSSGTELTLSNAATLTATGVELTSPARLRPGHHLEVRVFVKADATLPKGPLPDEAEVSGGEALPVTTTTTIAIDPLPAPFDFLPGFEALPTQADGTETTLAGAHPYAFNLNFDFPTEKPSILVGAGHVRDLKVDFPRGMVVNPNSTPVLCTEAELATEVPGCPAASTVGTVTVRTVEVTVKSATSPVYNMVPPPGQAAELGFDALGAGIFVHVGGEVRNDGDYGITGASEDILALTAHPIFGATMELWGDPSAPAHDGVRGLCSFAQAVETCPVPKTKTGLLALPVDCPHAPLRTEAHADSWEQPGVFKEASFESAAVEGCNQLEFEPTITARPTTNLTDSSSGLDVDLHQPQNFDPEGRSTAILKDISLNLPEGLVVNPSQGEGLAACTIGQVGLTSAIGQTPIRFSKPADQCPAASKLGNVTVRTPLLKEPLPGSVYIAKPFANPFGSLLAVYLTVNDPRTGVVAKLAGEVHADPVTGRLTTSFKENPELPLEDAEVHLFGGARGALRTPPACATYTSAAHMVPWSAPESVAVDKGDSFATTAAPGGGTCPATAPGAPNKPNFVAGTIAPKAGAYSPFTLKVSREDGSQPLGGFEATLPSGLTAKLAGVPACSEAQIAAAKARSNPNEGALELANPSCPAATEIGTVAVTAGAGPTPLNVSGHAYMAGPYKGAPLSAVIITPAVAGPFDLGVVVVRAAIYVNPETALVRTVSDPLPTILDGIPLDLRSATVRLARPKFTLNPTSCEPKSVLATTTSVFGLPAALSAPFQVGGCSSLPFAPKLHTRLSGPIHRGGHPRLRAVFEAKPGEANTARIVFALPRSEFIDQAHFRTICTRVQFAADQCPAGSVYGHVKAITPLLDYTLEGPVYLRSSSHKLPDVVAALKGPPSQPIEFDLDGRVDSVNGGVRTTFETVPDAPVTKAIVTLQGAKKGLFQNSTNICKGTHRANLKLTAQSGKVAESRPQLKADCGGKGAKKKKRGAVQH
jgi:hypothetical protein